MTLFFITERRIPGASRKQIHPGCSIPSFSLVTSDAIAVAILLIGSYHLVPASDEKATLPLHSPEAFVGPTFS
jgi:hypothetical protein